MSVGSGASLSVGIIDYGVGNLFNVERALRHVGGDPYFISSGPELLAAKCLVLPGVGAFGDGAAGLRSRNLMQPLREYAASGRPLLGICLGMQLLFDWSSEFGTHEGLGIIPGDVAPLEVDAGNPRLKLPHIGWAPLVEPAGEARPWEETLLRGIQPEDSVYFVHTYVARPARPEWTLAEGTYGPARFCAVVQKDNVLGCQFHPERSGRVGLSILENFVHTYSH